MNTKIFTISILLLSATALQGCKHPLAIVGEGDIIDLNSSRHGCTLEQFQAQDAACTENEVGGDYFVNYEAQPRSGWRFVRWEGPCSNRSDFQNCRFDITQAEVAAWDEAYPDAEVPASVAVFQRVTGKTGYLVDTVVAGLAYETPTQQGVTGRDGSFQYEEGETVRFMLGSTLVGEVIGRDQVTPFDLAASRVIAGTPNITRALENELNPFHTVINIAVLLQSMDDDGSPENGIMIKQSVATLFEGVNLNVKQHWKRFQDEPGLHGAVARANRRHSFNKPHGPAKPAAALQHLYATLGIDGRTSAVILEQGNVNGDGSLGTTAAFWYDSNGNPISREQDYDEDGTPKSVQSWSYDSQGNMTRYEEQRSGGDYTQYSQYDTNGNLIRRQRSEGGDDRFIDVETWRYDVNDNLTRHTLDYDGDGRLDSIEKFEYDASGNLVRETEDGDADGSPERIATYTYDSYGNVTRRTIDETHDSSPASVDTWTYQYDADGRPTRRESDHDNDGTTNSIETYQYDADGNLAETGYDLNADGRPDLYETWQYDARGNLTQHTEERGPLRKLHSRETWRYDERDNLTRHEQDENGDGQPEANERWEYDANDSPTLHEQDFNGDGVIDEIDRWQYQYQYDASGRLVQRDRYVQGEIDEIVNYSYGGNGELSHEERWTREVELAIHIWEHDAGGKLTRELIDEGADGTINQSVIYDYDKRGNLVRQEEDRDGDGAANYIESYEYDTRGRVTRRDLDEGGDGIAETTDGWVYQYDANGRPVRKEWDQYIDGTTDLLETWTYDARGNTTGYEWRCNIDAWACLVLVGFDFDHLYHYGDYYFDPVPVASQIVSYEYDANDRLVREKVVTDRDGDTDDIRRYEYDASGNRTHYEKDTGGNGTMDHAESWQYDASGNVTRHEWDRNGDGIAEEAASWAYQYDANGNLTREEGDENSDGRVDWVESYEYDADGNLIRQSRADDQDGDGQLETTEIRNYEATGWGHIFASGEGL